MVELIDTGHISEHRDSLLSDAARTAGGGPLRFFAMLLLTSAVVLGIGFTLSDRVLGPAAALLSRAESLITGHQAVLPGNGNALLATPTLPGTLMLTPLSPAELMQQYPPAAGQSLSDDNFDLPAWQRFQRPAAASADQPRVAVLVTSLGLNKALTAAAILYLPPAVSLSFSPYAPELAAWIDAARAHGHEALVDLPLESAAPQDDPGRDGLMTGLRAEENDIRLNRVIDRAPHVFAVATALGSRFLTDQTALQPVLADLAAQGMAIIEASPDPRLLTDQMASAARLRHLKATLAIDEAESRETILHALATVTADLPKDAHRLVVAAPSPLSLALIDGWCRQLTQEGLALTPASNMLAQ